MQIPVFKDEDLPALSRLEPAQAVGRPGSTMEGLSLAEAQERLKTEIFQGDAGKGAE